MYSDLDLSCKICFEPYNHTDKIPRILPKCGHTFCSACLEKIAKNSARNGFACPDDR